MISNNRFRERLLYRGDLSFSMHLLGASIEGADQLSSSSTQLPSQGRRIEPIRLQFKANALTNSIQCLPFNSPSNRRFPSLTAAYDNIGRCRRQRLFLAYYSSLAHWITSGTETERYRVRAPVGRICFVGCY